MVVVVVGGAGWGCPLFKIEGICVYGAWAL